LFTCAICGQPTVKVGSRRSCPNCIRDGRVVAPTVKETLAEDLDAARVRLADASLDLKRDQVDMQTLTDIRAAEKLLVQVKTLVTIELRQLGKVARGRPYSRAQLPLQR
jgi:hypothetical protein